MAELLSSYVVTEILKLVQSVATDAITRAWGLKGDLLKLSDSAGRLQSLLQKVQYVQSVKDDEHIKRWLEKLQEVVYAVVDVVDEFHYEILRRKVEIKNQKWSLCDFVSHNNPILFRVNMAFKVKEVWASLVAMEKEAPLVLLTMTAPATTIALDRGVVLESLPDRRTYSFLDQRPIGREKEAERIIQMVKVKDNMPLLSVISIVGFGGLGKTTLAQLVFEDTKQKKLFDEMMWVCVSEPFDAQKILGEMLEKLDTTTGGLRNIDVIVGKLQHHLKDKRFLLVLDDVWNKESAKWDTLKMRLEKICGKSGNFVITTTRGGDVADIMQSKHVEKLEQLSNTECWNIIKDKIVGSEGKSIISREMEAIGMAIASKCGGVPLVAIIVGGVLSSRKNKVEWLSILDSNVWNEVDEDKRISEVLKLSFDHLPPPQKLCFAYCSLFPKDFVFEKAQLVQLWMAEDFLHTTSKSGEKSDKVMEDVGDDYFHSLLVNSFFQDAQVDDCGNVVRCKMHDLIHDFALSISNSQSLQCGSDCIETIDGRRMRCSCNQASKVKEILVHSEDRTRNLRCLLCRVDISPMLSNFRRLRSLDMSNANLKDLSDAIGKLKHLRYLDISKNETIQEMPKSITKLYNLQTLRVFECKSLNEFPSKIRNLVSLRHLGVDDKRLMPLGVGCLTNLQTLPFFVVGVEKDQKIDELEGLKELRGELVICCLENVRDKVEAERARMKEKKLSKLVLQWMEIEKTEAENLSSSGESKHEEVMEGLQAPTNIQSLAVEWYMGKEFPEWMHQLYNLEKLILKDCRRCERMPTLGHLPYLKVLTVERMDRIKFMGDEFYGKSNDEDTLFPSVEELSIIEMKSLVEWMSPKRSEIFPKLHKLNIMDCPNLISFPLSQSTSSTYLMQVGHFGRGGDFVNVLCFIDFKYFKALGQVRMTNCPKLTFLHIDSTSLRGFHFIHKYFPLWRQGRLVQNLALHSNELGGSWRTIIFNLEVEIIKEFPKSLEALDITGCHKFSEEAFHGLSCLKHLQIQAFPRESVASLESIPSLSSLTSLKYLMITSCDRLKAIPTLSSLTSLEHLEIDSCDNLSSVPGGLVSCQSLKKLVIVLCDKLGELWSNSFSKLTCLEELHISSCRNLRSLPSDIKLCTSLKELTVRYCRKMMSIDDQIMGSLTQLKKLEWGPFSNELDKVPGFDSMHLLTSMEQVTMYGWDKLTSLPHQLQRLTSVTELKIYRFNGLENLPDWLCNLSSLQTLTILHCKNLKNFPTCMQRLSKLSRLEVQSCPLLWEMCLKDIGPEWSNISHIPYIKIEHKVIQDLRCGTNAEISV